MTTAMMTQPTFPKLQGSEKQIAWATDIRQTRWTDAMVYRDKKVRRIERGDADSWEFSLAEIDAAITALMTKNDAKFWIDQRNRDVEDLIMRCLDEM